MNLLTLYEILSEILPFTIFLLIINLIYKHKIDVKTNILLILFALYIIGVFYFTGSGTIWDGLFKNFEIRFDQINLVPFKNQINIIEYILNIILFMPFGFLTPFICKKELNLYKIIIKGFSFSLLIELSQLLNNRSFDINDLILNTLGAVIGYVLFKLCKKNFKLKQESQMNFELIIILIIFISKFIFFNEYLILNYI